jgi:hypothetical protein
VRIVLSMNQAAASCGMPAAMGARMWEPAPVGARPNVGARPCGSPPQRAIDDRDRLP